MGGIQTSSKQRCGVGIVRDRHGACGLEHGVCVALRIGVRA